MPMIDAITSNCRSGCAGRRSAERIINTLICRRNDHTGRGGDDRGSGHLRPGDYLTTCRRNFAADSLQMAAHATIDSIRDCGTPARSRRCGKAGHPVAGDVLAAAYPHLVVAQDVLNKVDQRLGATGMTGQAHMQADRHHSRALGSLLVEEVEAVAQKREEVLAGAENAAG